MPNTCHKKCVFAAHQRRMISFARVPAMPCFMFRAALVLLLMFASAPAQALSLMDPFNLPGTLDAGVTLAGQDIAYAPGPRHKLDVYVPDEIDGTAPVLVFIYGGAWRQGTKADYPFVGHAFAAQGFVTVVPDYRLVPNVAYPDFLNDNAKAIKWVEDNIHLFGGDKERIFIAGHSAGAYNAVMLGMDRTYLTEAGVTEPIRGVVGLSGPFAVYPFEFTELQDAFGHVDNPQMTQPINMSTANTVPMFLGHGSMDLIVSVENTTAMEKKFLAENHGITTKIYDGIGHMEAVWALAGIYRWRGSVLDDVINFLNGLGAFDPEGFGPIDLVPESEPGTEPELPVTAATVAAELNQRLNDGQLPPLTDAEPTDAEQSPAEPAS